MDSYLYLVINSVEMECYNLCVESISGFTNVESRIYKFCSILFFACMSIIYSLIGKVVSNKRRIFLASPESVPETLHVCLHLRVNSRRNGDRRGLFIACREGDCIPKGLSC